MVNLQELYYMILHILEGIGAVLLIVAIFFTPLFGLYYLVKYTLQLFENWSFGRQTDIQYAELILSSKFTYYQKLNDRQKAKFLRRLVKFIGSKSFTGSGGLVLTDEMKILISATAIQLTFGLKEFRLNHFSKIFVYPKAFYSKISKQYHKGETNLAGAIALSWSDFTEGLNKPHDKVNLGLHEMAHALRFDKFKSDDYDTFFNMYYDKWHMIAQGEFKKIKGNSTSFFREYGGTNFNEFFAVCVETFFESPSEFNRLYPEIYKHLSILLNQDPLVIITDNTNSLRNNHNPEFVPGGKVYYATTISGIHIASLIFAGGFWLYILVSHSGMASLDYLILCLIMPVVGYFIVERAFNKVIFYENGIYVKSLVPSIFHRNNKFSYAEVVCVEFTQKEMDQSNDSIWIAYLDKGKIQTRNFTDSFTRHEVLGFADYLVTKKVAVKLNALTKYFSHN